MLWSSIFVDAVQQNLCTKCKCETSIYFGRTVFAVNCTYAGISGHNVYLLEQLPETTEVGV